MCLFLLFIKKSTSAVLNVRWRVSSRNRNSSRKTPVMLRYLTTHIQIVNFLMDEYANDTFIAEIELEITKFAQPAGMKTV